jgi:hypothetical protein
MEAYNKYHRAILVYLKKKKNEHWHNLFYPEGTFIRKIVNGPPYPAEKLKEATIASQAAFKRLESEGLVYDITGDRCYALSPDGKQLIENNFQDTSPNIKLPIKPNVKDIFICHATKDKNDHITPFLERLSAEKISYWYDEAEIKWGDSLVEKINEGIRISRFIVIFLSKNFIDGNWTEKELNAALNIEIDSGKTKVLPLIIGAENEEKLILEKYPLLKDKKFIRWSDGFDSIINSLRICLDKRKPEVFTNQSDDLKYRRDEKGIKKSPPVKFRNYHKVIIIIVLFSVSVTIISIKSCNINFIFPKKDPGGLIDQEKVLLTLRYAYNYKYVDGVSFKGSANVPGDISRPIMEGDIIPFEILRDNRLYLGVWNGVDDGNALLNPQLFIEFSPGIKVIEHKVYRKMSDREFNASLPIINAGIEETPIHPLRIEAKPGMYSVKCTITTVGMKTKTTNFKLQVY